MEKEEKLLKGGGLGDVWNRTAQMVKQVTGDVDVVGKGNLQEQVDQVNENLKGKQDKSALVMSDEGVHGLRFDGETLYAKDINGVEHEIHTGGGSEISLSDVSGASVSTSKTTATIKWSDPTDVIIGGATLATWDGTLLVKKEGSAPENRKDGIIIADCKTRNQYSTSGLIDTGLEYGKTYYYRFFPYSKSKTYTNGSSLSVVPVREKITTVPTQNGSLTYNKSSQSATFNNYDSSKLTIGGTTSSTNAGTYTATFAPKEDYEWSDGSRSGKNVNWTIGKANGSATLSTSSVTLNSDNKQKTVTVTNPTGTVSVSTNNSSVATASVSSNTVTIKSVNDTDGTATITISIAESANYKATSKSVSVTADFFKIVTWADGTDKEIAAMLEAHYNGDIDISDYWAVGDVRSNVPLSAIPSGTTGESQSAQNIDLIIIGINHDNLSTNKDTRTKAAITVQTKNCLNTKGYMNSGYRSPSYALWSTCKRRTWCNDKFKAALPSELSTLIKQITKLSDRYCDSSYSGYSSYRTQETTQDYVFLLSQFEQFGTNTYNTYGNLPADGTQYEYMKTRSNRVKSVNGSANIWYGRSFLVNSDGNASCIVVDTYGDNYKVDPDDARGLAPAFCL